MIAGVFVGVDHFVGEGHLRLALSSSSHFLICRVVIFYLIYDLT